MIARILSKKEFIVILFVLLSLFTDELNGQNTFSFEFLPGGAITPPTKLTIVQEGYPAIGLKAKYRHENFNLPLYYSYRVAYNVNQQWGCEIEMNHLKIILTNTTPEVEEFSVTHGFNQLWINAGRTTKGFKYRVGVGGVIAHPENIVRSMRYDGQNGIFKKGYHLCGVTSQLSVQKSYFIGKHFFISGEGKINAAYAEIPVVNGHAKTTVYAIHFLAGAGIVF